MLMRWGRLSSRAAAAAALHLQPHLPLPLPLPSPPPSPLHLLPHLPLLFPQSSTPPRTLTTASSGRPLPSLVRSTSTLLAPPPRTPPVPRPQLLTPHLRCASNIALPTSGSRSGPTSLTSTSTGASGSPSYSTTFMATAASSSASEEVRAKATSAASSPTPAPFPPFTFLHSAYQPPYRLPPSPVPSFYSLASWPDDPLHVFCSWYADAERAYHAKAPPADGVAWPNTMQLATAVDGLPHVRHVLLKGLDARGLIFFTNYEGGKGRQLRANPRAAVCFYWKGLERQVRMEGTVEEVSGEESDDYFHARPLGSQISAAVSCQSRPISSRAELEDHYVAQVHTAILALHTAKGHSHSPAPPPLSAPLPASSPPSLPLSIPSVASSTSSPTASSPDASASHAQHLHSVSALAALQEEPSNAPLLATAITRPPHWGGILIRPHLVEFWEDGQYRLHSRVEYTRTRSRCNDAAHSQQGQHNGHSAATDAAANDKAGCTSDWEWSKRFLAP